MVGIKFNGRLGNQIFQLAFFMYLKSNNKQKLFYFVNYHHSYLHKYFEFDVPPYSWFYSRLTFKLTNLFLKLFPHREIYIQNIQIPKPVQVKDWSVYKGFFQTDWYLKNSKEKLNLNLKKEYVQEFENKFGQLFKSNKIVVVHIRRTDYLNYGKRDISLPMEYFKTRLDEIENLDDYLVYFVSDDIEFAKSYFGMKSNFHYSSNSEIIDFQIIKNADIAIISNSSFAWWACFLSKKNNIVYAPKNWLGFRIGKEHPKGIMTDKFIWCEVIK